MMNSLKSTSPLPSSSKMSITRLPISVITSANALSSVCHPDMHNHISYTVYHTSDIIDMSYSIHHISYFIYHIGQSLA